MEKGGQIVQSSEIVQIIIFEFDVNDEKERWTDNNKKRETCKPLLIVSKEFLI